MRLNKFDLNNLVCLDALLAERSITRAAERLFLSRPAMSNALARLREYFNDELLVQVGKAMVPTPFALSLQQPTRDLLLRMQAITSTLPSHIELATVSRKISITCSDYVAAVFVPTVLLQICAQAPNITFDIRPFSSRFLDEIDSGEVDFLITSDTVTGDTHPAELLFKDSFSCVVWAGNGTVGDTLSLDEFMSFGHVGTRWDIGRVNALDEEYLSSRHMQRRVEVWVSAFSQVPQFVVGTQRVGTMQTRLAHAFAAYLPLRVVSSPVPIPYLNEMLQWHHYQESDPVLAWVRGQFRLAGAMLSEPRA